MRFIRLTFVILTLSSCGSLMACLNDSELPDHEREFRSQYLETQLTTSRDSSTPADDDAWMVSAAGVTLFAGAIGLTWFGRP